MKITLKLIGILQEIIKEEEFIFPENSIRVKQLFKFLADRYGSIIEKHLLPEDSKSHYAVLVNGQNIQLAKNLMTELRDGDRVVVLPFLPGG